VRRLIASWFGSGLILGRVRGDHSGSGTVGAAVAFVLAIVTGSLLGVWGQVGALLVVTAASLWSTDPFVTDEGDAGWIVIDEAAGTFLALLGLGLSPAAFVAFVVFRAADIFKKVFPGVAAAEQLGGPVGVTADDLVAGLYGLVAGQAVRLLM
jgi:phosphatidylglycerophosphatase A